MTANDPNYRQPLGVGSIVGDAFGIYFRRFGLMFMLSLIPAAIVLLLSLAIPSLIAGAVATDPTTAALLPALLVGIIQLLAYSLSISLIVLAAFDTKLNRPGRLGVYVRWALVNLFTVVVLWIAVSLMILAPIIAVALLLVAIGVGSVGPVLIGIAAGLFALYVSAAFSPVVPAVVIEGVGFGGLGRALALTSGYRWPIVGTIVVLVIVIILIGLVFGLVAGMLMAAGATWLVLILQLAVGAITGGIFAVGIAMIYARLREIKEGMDVDSLADVFK